MHNSKDRSRRQAKIQYYFLNSEFNPKNWDFDLLETGLAITEQYKKKHTARQDNPRQVQYVLIN